VKPLTSLAFLVSRRRTPCLHTLIRLGVVLMCGGGGKYCDMDSAYSKRCRRYHLIVSLNMADRAPIDYFYPPSGSTQTLETHWQVWRSPPFAVGRCEHSIGDRSHRHFAPGHPAFHWRNLRLSRSYIQCLRTAIVSPLNMPRGDTLETRCDTAKCFSPPTVTILFRHRGLHPLVPLRSFAGGESQRSLRSSTH
jgi:hypothetical protein